MSAYIVLLWALIKLQAPTWCYVIVAYGISIRALGDVLYIAIKISERRLEDERKKLEELKERIGSNRE